MSRTRFTPFALSSAVGPRQTFASENGWQSLRSSDERVHIRLLDLDSHRDAYVFLLRMLPGVELPGRRVTGASTVITLQGRWKYRDGDWVAGPESFLVEASDRPLTTQTLPDCTDDVLLLVIGRGDLQWLDGSGAVVAVENCASLRARFPGWTQA